MRVLRKRDSHCWHCGETVDLVPHHRKNRQMGGSKSKELKGYPNLILVCAIYNGQMESDSRVAQQARDYGHKLSSWDNTEAPVFDVADQRWYKLDAKGNKTITSEPGLSIFD